MTGDSVIHPNSGLRIGSEVDSAPAPRPRRTTLPGRLVTVTALDPKTHEEALYEGTHGPDKERLWLYLGEGPFPDRASFRAYLENRAISDDPLSFAIVYHLIQWVPVTLIGLSVQLKGWRRIPTEDVRGADPAS